MSKTTGLEERFEVRKITNPGKPVNCLVLEFDDHHARTGIRAYAAAVRASGYHRLADDLERKLQNYTT